MRFLLFLCSAVLFLSCESSANKMDVALSNGELSKAESLLSDMSGSEMYRYSSRLIDEYLSIGNLDKAIRVFNDITPHCSMYEMQYTALYSSASYTKDNAKKIYNALLGEEEVGNVLSIASALGVDDARAVLMLADLVKEGPELQVEL